MHEWVHCCDGAATHQFPIVEAFWIIWIVSMHECSSLTQNLMQMHCSTYLVILNVMTTQHTCSLSGIYYPHWLVQWSHHCSHMCIPVHSPWLPVYNDVAQTILVILTVAGIFLDTQVYICIYVYITSSLFIQILIYIKRCLYSHAHLFQKAK